jgi:16S rRNA processing protein RimM
MKYIGKFVKTYGFAGVLVLASEQTEDEALECLTEIFVVIEGLKVPFPVENFTFRNENTALVKLEFVDSVDEAAELTGCEVFAEVELRQQEEEEKQWTGFAVHDAVHGNIGIISQIENFNGNVVMQVVHGEKENLIPLHPELITKIDRKCKILYIRAPEGSIQMTNNILL